MNILETQLNNIVQEVHDELLIHENTSTKDLLLKIEEVAVDFGVIDTGPYDAAAIISELLDFSSFFLISEQRQYIYRFKQVSPSRIYFEYTGDDEPQPDERIGFLWLKIIKDY